MGAIASCLAINLCECAACMACSCCTRLVEFSLSQAARFAHTLILLLVFTLAIILGKEYPDKINGYNYYTKIDLLGGCDDSYEDNCIYRQLVYRASFASFLLFAVLALASFASDYVNRSLWVIKFGAAIGLFIAFWWADNSFFSGWAEVARVVSFLWLLVQGLLFIDFSHDAHEMLMSPKEGEPNQVLYLGLSAAALALAVLGLVYLFLDYSGCDLGMFFIVLTLLVGVLTTIVSLLEQVSAGLLTPCLVFAYGVFMCWYALLSNPSDACNPTASSVNGTLNGALIVVATISVVILLYCVANGTKILNIFLPQGEGVMMSYNASEMTGVLVETPATEQPAKTGETQRLLAHGSLGDAHADRADGEAVDATPPKSSGTPQERSFFHGLLMLVSCYGAMILTNWGRTDGAPASTGSHEESDESMWLKIVALWVFYLLHVKILHVHYTNNQP